MREESAQKVERPVDQIVNSHSLERSQIKGTPLHQGQLLDNRLRAKHLTDALLLNPGLRMAGQSAGTYISSPFSSGRGHRFSSLSLGPDSAGLGCHRADLGVCEAACVKPPPGWRRDSLRMSNGREDKERGMGLVGTQGGGWEGGFPTFLFFFLISVPQPSFFSATLSNCVHEGTELAHVRDNQRTATAEDRQRSISVVSCKVRGRPSLLITGGK